MKIPFSPPYIDNNVIEEVIDSLHSGWITTGCKVKALEEEIKNVSQAPQVLCVNSWTSGVLLMLKWFGIRPDDEIIIPAYTYCATALAPYHVGAKVIMVDVKDDFNISIDALRKAITPKTKVIIPVDIAGFPCDYDKIMNLVQEPEIKSLFHAESENQQKLNRIMVLNDAAHSLGATTNGVSTGSKTDVTIFSLHAVKNITTAEGGAICLNLPEPFDNGLLYTQLRRMTLNGQTKDAFTKSQTGSWRYDIVEDGIKINMPDVNAAIGLAQMRSFRTLYTSRKQIVEHYHTAFKKQKWAITPPTLENGKESSYHYYPLRIKDFTEEQRDAMIEEIAQKEIAVNVHFIPLPMLTFFKGLGYKMEDYPQAYNNYKCEISLPVYPQLSIENVNHIIDTVIETYNKITQ